MKRVAVLAAMVVAGIPAASIESARPPQLLTYTFSESDRGSPYNPGDGLCLSRPNGRDAVHVTRRRDDRASAWSPNGKYVAFSRQFEGDRIFDVLVADTRGRILANLSDGQSVMETSPTWAPDNRRIAFAGGWRGSSIWLTNRAGGPVKRFLANGGQPAWAPNGKTLAFTYFHGWYGTERRVETIGIDRTGRRVIATDASDPTWSPDSRRLAFVTKTGAGASEITVANSDGSGARALTASREEEFAPAWSPNGKWIAFERREPDDRNDRHWIVVVDAETSVERWTIRGGHGLHDPSWRPQVLLPRARRGSCR